MMACLVITQIHLLLHFSNILVASLFLMLCMNATVISSASEMVHLYSNTTMVNGCIETERQALLNIKRGFVDKHGLLSSWGSPQQEDCCQWTRVGCDIRTGHVTHLNLSHLSNDFTYVTTYSVSNISRLLLELKNLIYLDLSWNNFGGLPIPEFIGSLASLAYVDLSNANFSAIPHELGNLSMLNHLDLSYNSFNSSPIPKLIASFTSLTYLNLSGNQFIGAIPHELGNLSKLHHLDLSHNYGLEGGNFGWLVHLFYLTHIDLSEINIGASSNWLRLIQRLPSLSVLLLNGCGLNSTIAPSSFSSNSSSSISTLHLIGNQLDVSIFDWLSNLSGNLVDLDLSGNLLKGKIPESLAYMTSIKRLVLSSNELDGDVPTNFFCNLSTLQFLDLSGNYLSGKLEDILYVLPEDSLQVLLINRNRLTGSLPDITRFSSLEKLDVSYNQLNGYLPNLFKHNSTVRYLDLSQNDLRGSLPSFTGFPYLNIFYLFENKFSGTLPRFTGLLFLEYLHLGENKFSGSLPDFMGLQSLKELYLGYNRFSGSLPDFTGLQSLTELYLDYNKFVGSIPDFTGCSYLQVLSLSENEITEWKTQSIGKLTNLTTIVLSKNSIHSTISESQLSNLSSLTYMNASFNSLTFNLSSGWLPPFQLQELYLASCKLGPKFPTWIRNQTQIVYLDLSNNQISDTIPMWFWNISTTIKFLDLSSNNIKGEISSNNFEGQVPLFSSRSVKIDLSNNKFSGKLFSFSAVEDMDLTYLDCSHNLFFGILPNSWVHFQHLVYLNVAFNNFSGEIPMSMANLISLETLILRNNSFYGGFPDSLRNCSQLGFLDFGFNNISGKIPEWVGEDLPQLYAVILKSNKFYGRIPRRLCHLSNLHFLDLSINRISGTVPPCFGNFTSMIQNGTEIAEHAYMYNWVPSYDISPPRYVDNVLADWKGQELEYGRNFAYLKMIDLSQNELTGDIPIQLTRLLDLNGLNLSGNKFYGEVPQEMGRLKLLESLDLSRNKFSGKIPQSLSGLNFLAYLDLSCNNFSGRIPSGTQLQSFNASVYEMNSGLCGPPLKEICPGDEADVDFQPSSDRNEADEDEIEYKRWLYICTTLGFGTTFWGICGILVLNRRWRHAYFLFLNNLKDRLYVIMTVRIARFRS